MRRELIFVDTETTGLDDDPDSTIVELTYATLDSEPKTLFFGVESVPEFVDELIGFTERGISGVRSNYFEFDAFLRASENNTMVAANPAFDAHFIKNAGLWQFHYRKLDIQSYAMSKLGLSYVPGMADIYNELREDGYDISEPNHTSHGDVVSMREAYNILRLDY